MNLLFVVPKTNDMPAISPGICYVAAATKNAGHNTFGVNLNHSGSSDHQRVLTSSIKKNDIDAVFIGGTSGDFSEVAK
ncbi:hypothetical protein N9893_03040, partial [bacterium]|nr:hypothetical protein [bacterium]